MTERPHWSSRLAVESALLLAATSAGTAGYLVFVVLLEFGNLRQVSIRLAPTPLPRSYAHGSVVALGAAVLLLVGTLAVASAARRRQNPERRLAAAVGETVAVQRYDLGLGGAAALRVAATAVGFALGVAWLVWLPADLPLGVLGVTLAAAAGAGTALWWSRPLPGLAAAGIGVVLVAYPPVMLRLVHLVGPRQALGNLAATDATWLVVLAWTPLVGIAGLAAHDLALDRRAGLPLVFAFLLVAAGTVGTAGPAPERPDPRATVDPAGSVNLSETRAVFLPYSAGVVNRSVVAVGVQRFHNPASRTRIATVPDVRACLFTPERQEIDVRQGRLEGEQGTPWLYPIVQRFRMAPAQSVTTRLLVDVDQFDNATVAAAVTVPVTVADSCPEQSDEPKLVLYSEEGYDPTIVHGVAHRPTESHPRD